MAKKKTRKTKEKSFEHSEELYGVLLVLCAILGIGKYGPVGKCIASFGLFLVGSLYMVFLVVLFIIGIYLIIKRKWPDFLNTRLLGLYLIVIGLLIMMHREFVLENDGNMMAIFRETINQLVASFNSIMNSGSVTDIFSVGGGIVGGSFAIIFDKLFSFTGMQIVSWTLIGIGLALFTGFSIIEMVRDTLSKRREANGENRREKSKVIISDGDEEKEPVSGEAIDENKHIVISSIDDLKTVPNPKEEIVPKEDIVAEQKKETVHIENKNYRLPPLDILDKPKKKNKGTDQTIIEKNITVLEKVLADFAINGKVVEVHVGPTVTQYELEIKSGTKVNKILSLNREISLALAKKDVRIEAPIPGKNTVGIEIPNDSISPVSFREVFERIPENKKNSKLLVPLGKNIMGNVIWCEIDKTPHLLVAGATGSGKSVCINGIISTILMRTRPDEVRLVMVDPKKVELSVYNGVPHLLCPVVTDPKKASVALAKIVTEMEKRYDEFESTKTKNIATYNAYIDKHNAKASLEDKKKRMPYIVVIVDELADLMLVASKDVQASIMRITQMARAAGIHLIIATQRPSTNVITGVIKANIPSRIAFAVSSNIDSRTILDHGGAEKLLGKGDMLFLPMGEMAPQRVQGAFISDDEIKRIIEFTANEQQAEFDENMINLNSPDATSEKSASQMEDKNQKEDYEDPLYNEIVEFVISSRKASASLLQRRFKLGYNRAARIVDLLEERGIIGPSNGSKPREVLVTLEPKDEDE